MAFDVRMVRNRRRSWFVALCSSAVRVGGRPQQRQVQFSRHAEALGDVVPRNVVCDESEERSQRITSCPPPYSTNLGNNVLSRMRRVISSAVRYFSPSR
jgi:hypothetical protein